MPRGVRNLVRSVYQSSKAHVWVGADYVELFDIRTGVLQGCPLSGLLLAVCMDPLLRAFESLVGRANLGHIKACADDDAAVLYSLRSLPVLHGIFPWQSNTPI